MVNSIFTNVQGMQPRRRAYNMSYRNDYTSCLAELVPVYWQDLIPNSSLYIRTHGLIRFLPMVAPIMDNIDYYVHFWQAPYRILYGDQFTDLITGELSEEESDLPYFTPAHILDVFDTAGVDEEDVQYIIGNGSLFDMLGYDFTLFNAPTTKPNAKLNARKFIMYARLLQQWYINENVEPWEGFVDDLEAWTNPKNEVQGDISARIARFCYGLLVNMGSRFFCHAWPKDYFTSALPTLQYGLPTYLPMNDVPVVAPDGLRIGNFQGAEPISFQFDGTPGNNEALEVARNRYLPDNSQKIMQAGGTEPVDLNSIAGPIENATNPANPALVAKTSEATITINELRVANAIQIFKEREMRFGRRAPEYYKGFYGIRPRDMRLQIPEYIGGGRMPINISDVEQTSQTTESSPQGNLSGKGTGLSAGFATAKVFTPEEAFVIGLAWAMPKVTYSTLLSRHDTKLNDRFLYFNPTFVHIGEQEVYNYELYAGTYGTELGNREFGYQPRYTEYRFHSNEMHGMFKDSLSFWTLGRIFDSQPAYNARFIYMRPLDLNRIFAVRTDTDGHAYPNLLVSLKFQVSLIQPLSRYGTPGLMM